MATPAFKELVDLAVRVTSRPEHRHRYIDLVEARLKEAQRELFEGVETERYGRYVLRDLALKCSPMIFHKGEKIIIGGTQEASATLIVDGLVRIYREEKTGAFGWRTSAWFGVRGPGAHVGVPTAILEEKHFYTCEACSECSVFLIPHKDFYDAHAASPQLARNVLRAFNTRYRTEVEDRDVMLHLKKEADRAVFMFLVIARAIGDPNADRDADEPDEYRPGDPQPPYVLDWLDIETLAKYIGIERESLGVFLRSLFYESADYRGAVSLGKQDARGHYRGPLSIEKLQPLREYIDLQLRKD
jgi:CRP-like cAMP-binding protein